MNDMLDKTADLELKQIDTIHSDIESLGLGDSKTRDESFENVEIHEKSDKNSLNDDLLTETQGKTVFFKRIGNTWAFFFYKGEPLIVIGPHCKKIL